MLWSRTTWPTIPHSHTWTSRSHHSCVKVKLETGRITSLWLKMSGLMNTTGRRWRTQPYSSTQRFKNIIYNILHSSLVKIFCPHVLYIIIKRHTERNGVFFPLQDINSIKILMYYDVINKKLLLWGIKCLQITNKDSAYLCISATYTILEHDWTALIDIKCLCLCSALVKKWNVTSMLKQK